VLLKAKKERKNSQ